MNNGNAQLPEETSKENAESNDKQQPLAAPVMSSFEEDDVDAEPPYGGLLADGGISASRSSVDDQLDMMRMGKAQQLRRNFSQFSIICLSSLMMGTWEVLFVANVQGLTNGGLAGMFWSYVFTFAGMGCIAASLAEMASMAPTSGGPYHWVSEFAPPEYQKQLSYIVGWMATLSWQAGQASCTFITGSIIEALILYIHPSWPTSSFRETYFIFAAVVLCFIGNIWFSHHLPALQNALMGYHVIGFFVTIAIFATVSPQNSAGQVIFKFANFGGWSSMPLAIMVGQISALWALACADAAAHMSEETKDAAITIPRGMWWSYIINGTVGLVFVFFMLRAIPDVNGALHNPTGYPFLYIITLAMPNSPILSTIFTSTYILWGALVSIGFNASTSRQTFAFARDNGLPFARTMSYVHPRLMVPVTSVTVTCLISAGLSLINLGSNQAFTAIISTQILSLMLTYVASVGCVLHRRLTAPQIMPRARWSLGSWGVCINSIAVGYALFAFFWCFWPMTTSRALADFNWSGVIFATVLGFALLMYAVQGRWAYRGPVVLVQDRREGYEMVGTRVD